ncbi:MAG: J domain-containing protein [Myxococcales bacterium]|nr:J domain-containing protein [Myxococcales bacterium]
MTEDDAKLRILLLRKAEDMKRKDYFSGLGVTPASPTETIQAAYFGLAKQLHPDRVNVTGLPADDKDKAKQVFMFLTEAFNVLSDPAKRQAIARAQAVADAAGGSPTRRVERSKADEARLLANKAAKLMQTKAYDRAEAEYRQALAVLPKDVGILMGLGWAIFNNETHSLDLRLEEAYKYWKVALEAGGNDARLHYYFSLYFKLKGDTGRQRAHLESSLVADSNFVDAQRELRLLTMREKNSKSSLLERIFPSLSKKSK